MQGLKTSTAPSQATFNMVQRCHLADSVSRVGSASAITWKIFSPVSRDPGNAIPGSRLTGLKIFHVIAKLNFRVFNQCVEIPANGASLAHVIRLLVIVVPV